MPNIECVPWYFASNINNVKIGVRKYFNNNSDNAYHFFGNDEKYSSNSQRTCSQKNDSNVQNDKF